MTTSRHLLVLLVVAAGTAGCTLGAHTGTGPVMRIPEAPPRVVAELPPPPSEPETAPTEIEQDGSDTAAETPTETPTETPAPTLPTADQSGRRSAERDDAATNADTLAAEQEADETRVRRQLTSVPDEEVDRRSVEALLEETAVRLGRVDRSELTSAARAQYDTARRFLEQAESALAAGSVIFAHYLGQKALTLIREL